MKVDFSWTVRRDKTSVVSVWLTNDKCTVSEWIFLGGVEGCKLTFGIRFFMNHEYEY